MDRLNDLAARLRAVTWDADDAQLKLHVTLCREFLRRSALWAEALQEQHEWPFFDVAAAVSPGIAADPAVLGPVLESVADSGWYARRIAEWALKFATLDPPPMLPDPYEPLIRLYETRGDFATEAGFMNVDFVAGLYYASKYTVFLEAAPFTDL